MHVGPLSATENYYSFSSLVRCLLFELLTGMPSSSECCRKLLWEYWFPTLGRMNMTIGFLSVVKYQKDKLFFSGGR